MRQKETQRPTVYLGECSTCGYDFIGTYEVPVCRCINFGGEWPGDEELIEAALGPADSRYHNSDYWAGVYLERTPGRPSPIHLTTSPETPMERVIQAANLLAPQREWTKANITSVKITVDNRARVRLDVGPKAE